MFNIRKLQNDSKYVAVVTATDYENPFSDVFELEQKLQDFLGENQSGEVFFDLLCSNGFEWNRFLSLYFDGQNLQEDTLKIIQPSGLSSDLAKEQKNFFRKPDLNLKNSVLTNSQMHLVLNEKTP